MMDNWNLYEVYHYRNGIGENRYSVLIPVFGRQDFRWRWRAEWVARRHERAALRKEWKRVVEE